MGRIHLTHCLVGMAAAVALLLAFGVQAGTIFAIGAALLCPLMMVFCMRHMFGHGASHHAGRTAGADGEDAIPAAQR